MNDKEKAAADALLTKLAAAAPSDAVQYATAYESLMHGVLRRVSAEDSGDDETPATPAPAKS